MLRSNSSKLFIALAMIGMLGLHAQVFSQGNCYWDNWEEGAGASWWNNNVPAQYALSAEQISEINDIRHSYNEKVLPLQMELRSLKSETSGNRYRYSSDIDKTKEYRKKIRDLEAKIEDDQLNVQADINQLLSKEQQLYFNDGGYGWWNENDKCWHENRHSLTGLNTYGLSDYMDRCCR